MKIHSHNEICGAANLLYGSVLVTQAVCKGDGLGSMGVFITVEAFRFVSNSPMTEYFRFPPQWECAFLLLLTLQKQLVSFAFRSHVWLKLALDLMFQFR